MHKALLLLGLLSPSLVSSADLKLYVETNRAGITQVYIENVGTGDLRVLTRGLAYITTGNQTEISPNKHVWIRGDQRILLKDSLDKYGPVLLKPGEVTFIENPMIQTQSGSLTYRISRDWGTLHGTWSGNVEASF